MALSAGKAATIKAGIASPFSPTNPRIIAPAAAIPSARNGTQARQTSTKVTAWPNGFGSGGAMRR